jgi:hypothetical protein
LQRGYLHNFSNEENRGARMSLGHRLAKLETAAGVLGADGRCPACPDIQPVVFVNDESELHGKTLPECQACGWRQADSRMVYFVVLPGVDLVEPWAGDPRYQTEAVASEL